MKILQINSEFNNWSTGRTTKELHNAILTSGNEAYIAFANGAIAKEKNYYKIGNFFLNRIHLYASILFGNQGYYSIFPTIQFLFYMNSLKPDVVHLRNLHSSYINLNILLRYLGMRNIATVITLHDCWFYTGKCYHYTLEKCYKWQTQCCNCPRLKKDLKSYTFDFSRKMFNDKKKYVSKIKNFAVVCVSDWLKNEVEKSFLSKAKVIDRIYNWVDTDVFKPIDASDITKKYNLENKFIILGTAAYWSENKGILDFNKLAEVIPDDFQIVLVGKLCRGIILHPKILLIESTIDVLLLNKYFSMANVFLNLSYEETFGKVTIEAMACGTPAIVYNTTACPELIGDNCGFVVELLDVEKLYEKILEIKCNGKEYYSKHCINYIKEKFEYRKNALEYIKLYEELIK